MPGQAPGYLPPGQHPSYTPAPPDVPPEQSEPDGKHHPRIIPYPCIPDHPDAQYHLNCSSNEPGPDGIPALPLIERATAHLDLPDAYPHIGPDPSWNEWNITPVGYPLWLWTDHQPRHTTVTEQNITITLHATAVATTFNHGDTTSQTCTTTTEYRRGHETPGQPSPTCGHTYTTTGTHNLTATTRWLITWHADGIHGALTLDRTTTRTLTIQELEAIITG